MSDEPQAHDAPEPPGGETPWPQRVLDNLWLMLALSVAVPVLLYLVWGLWELAELPTWGGAP